VSTDAGRGLKGTGKPALEGAAGEGQGPFTNSDGARSARRCRSSGPPGGRRRNVLSPERSCRAGPRAPEKAPPPR